MLDYIENILREQKLVREFWRTGIEAWAAGVRKARRYASGEQRVALSKKQREMLRLQTDEAGFLANYCGLIIQAVSDRLEVDRIEAVDNALLGGGGINVDAANEWGVALKSINRFDGLQVDLHEALVRDGDTFIIQEWDEQRGYVRWAHELAYDGDTGVIPVYDRYERDLTAAIKVWYEPQYDNHKRVNIYYTDRVERYLTSDKGGGITRLPEADGEPESEWLPGIVPCVHFRTTENNGIFGKSALAGVYTLQDSLNRFLTSAVMTAELTAFPIRYMIGATPPDTVTPGMIIAVGDGAPVPNDLRIDVGTLQQGSVIEFINMMEFVINQMAVTTSTPLPTLMGGDTQSGEALKQREVGLLGTVRRLHTRLGNSYENAMTLSRAIQDAYGARKAPPVDVWDTKWKDPELRNDTEIIDNALKVADRIPPREFLAQIGTVYGWDSSKVDELMEEMEAAQSNNIRALAAGMTGLSEFGDSLNGGL